MHRVTELHAKYGEAVRIAPNEVSFTSPSAWDDIYGYRRNKGQYPLNKVWHSAPRGKPDSIMTAGRNDHSRIRRVISSAFTTSALRSQQPIIHRYVDKMMDKMHERAFSGVATINMVDWLNFVAFDTIGELAVHESFNCLDEAKFHPWIKLLFTFFKAACFVACTRFFPLLERIMMACMPRKLMDQQREHAARTTNQIKARMSTPKKFEDFPDFVDVLMKGMDNHQMTFEEVDSTMTVLFLGGSETVASTLSGTINNLVRNPDVLSKAAREIRTRFTHKSEMTFEGLETLPYLNGIIQEGLRLSPPVPSGIPRQVPPEGGVVSGYLLPPHVCV